ncbi:hypothetical protein N7462_011717 [Penicillium macrosclerotiorum]|uniref:uncharacterized protein n=1 Tax=Penicillium macrosclerotiorum TaxID=303699 RepID=UPI00254891FD|nr:uncharacterized protein N7462_011717 [Penicillium macrosclerotiorum]KAJ5662791.1 hypothetical protein N7462_011717 [Penicillium macrosclerotiorum]
MSRRIKKYTASCLGHSSIHDPQISRKSQPYTIQLISFVRMSSMSPILALPLPLPAPWPAPIKPTPFLLSDANQPVPPPSLVPSPSEIHELATSPLLASGLCRVASAPPRQDPHRSFRPVASSPASRLSRTRTHGQRTLDPGNTDHPSSSYPSIPLHQFSATPDVRIRGTNPPSSPPLPSN